MDRPTLLLVEDDPLIRSFLADNLTADGYELLVCGTMRDALRALEYHRPDLAVVDLKLPDGAGLDLIRRVRDADGVGSRLDPTLPLVILTGCAGEVDRIRGFEIGADDYVSKPFGYPELRHFGQVFSDRFLGFLGQVSRIRGTRQLRPCRTRLGYDQPAPRAGGSRRGGPT